MHLRGQFNTNVQQAWAFIRLGRLEFLLGGVVYHMLGVAAALASGAALNLPAWLWAQLAITATQLMTHYANDYYDLAHDRAHRSPTRWTGGSRILPDGLLPPGVALVAAQVLAGAALLAGVVLTAVVGAGIWPLAIVVAALVLSWFYSAPPVSLHSRGVGELAVALIVPGLTPLLGYVAQTGRLSGFLFLVILPPVLLQLATQLTINFPDAAADAATGKHTLVVRLGVENAARLHNALLVLVYGLLPLLALAGLPVLVVLSVAALLPLAVWQVVRVRAGAYRDPARWGSLAFGGLALVIGTALSETAALLLLSLLN